MKEVNYIIEVLSLDGETIFSDELLIGVFDECAIKFKADKYYIYPSIPVILSWEVTNAKSIELNSEAIESKGSKVVEPEKAAIYIIKANAPINTEAHANAQVALSSGKVKMLIDERDAKIKLLGTEFNKKTKFDMFIDDKKVDYVKEYTFDKKGECIWV